MKKYLLILGILSMNVLASPLDNLSVYGGLGLGGKADSVKSNSMPVNVGARYLYDVTTSIAVGPFVDYISESKFDGGMKSSALSYGVSGKYQHESGVYGIASLGLNSIDSNVNDIPNNKLKNGTTIIGTLGYMVNENIAVEAGYRNSSAKSEFMGNSNGDVNFTTFTLGGAYHF
jgi:opacity protein-like surface antigen